MEKSTASNTKQPREMAFSLFAVLPPGLDGRQSGIIQTGMTLRDYFAACSITGTCDTGVYSNDVRTLAARAYQLADAMMEARKDV